MNIEMLLNDKFGDFLASSGYEVLRFSITEEMIHYINQSIILKKNGSLKNIFKYDLIRVQEISQINEKNLNKETVRELYEKFYSKENETHSLIIPFNEDEDEYTFCKYHPQLDTKQSIEIIFMEDSMKNKSIQCVFESHTAKIYASSFLNFSIQSNSSNTNSLSFVLNQIGINLEKWT